MLKAADSHVTQTQFKHSMNGIDQRFDKIENDLTGIKGDVIGLRDDVTGLKSDVSGLKDDVTGLKSDVTVIKADIVGVKGDVAIIKTDIIGLKDEVHFLGIKLEDLDSKMDTLLEVCSPLLQKTTNHEERITRLEGIAPFK